MARDDLSEQLRRSKMEPFLLAGEVPLLAQQPHWAKMIKPVAPAVAGLIVVFALDTSLPGSVGAVVNLLWAGWLFLVGRAAVAVIIWRRNWFVATDKRLLVNYGVKLINVNLAMLSLSKVVDLSYTRSTMGFLLGYGTLVRESSGSGQTLHDVDWVKDPDRTYRTICAAVFNLADQPRNIEDDEHSHRFEDGPPRHAPGLYAEYVPLERRGGPIDVRKELDKGENDIPGIRIRYGESQKPSWPTSPELDDSVRTDATTGRIAYRRSPTEADQWVPTAADLDPDFGNPDGGSQDPGDEGLGDQDVDQSDDQGDDGDDGQS